KSLQLLLTYPFSDGTLGAMKGDYTNMSADLQLDLSDPKNLLGSLGVPTSPPSGTPTGGLPSVPGLPLPTGSVPGVPLPTGSSTSPTGGVGCPPICLAPGSGGSNSTDSSGDDGSWRSL